MATNAPAEAASSPVKITSIHGEEARRRKQSLSDRTTHSKKLSLNLPVLLPRHPNDVAQSPNAPASTPVSPAKLSSQPAPSPVVEAPEFLTLLAGQERKVLELREELGKAERELLALKKQWANLEASKKKSELRHIAKLQPLHSSDGKDDSETERERQRILEQTSGKPKRHTSQRVFSSSRHARQLSLLSPTSGEKPMIRRSLDEIASSGQDIQHLSQDRTNTIPMPMVESPKTLGKTYRDLANKNSLPPPSTDAIVRQGKQMATDLKDGLWTFLEDIRQATVGEEAVNGVQGEKGRPKMPNKRSSNTLRRKKRFSKDQVYTPTTGADSTKSTSFWREFGVDTPHHDPASRRVSDPLLDLDDEPWDAWESPQQQKQDPRGKEAPVETRDGEKMPWPELTKSTPSKLTRRVSDILKDWDSPDTKVVERYPPGAQAVPQSHILTS